MLVVYLGQQIAIVGVLSHRHHQHNPHPMGHLGTRQNKRICSFMPLIRIRHSFFNLVRFSRDLRLINRKLVARKQYPIYKNAVVCDNFNDIADHRVTRLNFIQFTSPVNSHEFALFRSLQHLELLLMHVVVD